MSKYNCRNIYFHDEVYSLLDDYQISRLNDMVEEFIRENTGYDNYAIEYGSKDCRHTSSVKRTGKGRLYD